MLIRRPHDRGGRPGAGPIDRAERDLAEWERLADGILSALMFRAKVIQDGELRRAIETLPLAEYEAGGYYERWAVAIEKLVLEKGLIGRDELDAKEAALLPPATRLRAGARVRVRSATRDRHNRTPAYVQGRIGTVTRLIGRFADPESRAHGGNGLPERDLYDVRFALRELWPGYDAEHDTVDVALYGHWLDAVDGPAAEPPAAARLRAIEALLIEKGILTEADIRTLTENLIGRSAADAARVVARAWIDAEFKRRLLADANAALGELGIEGAVRFTNLVAVENTDAVHHLVVGTLDSSGYPRQLAGPPPPWYKTLEYRARAVREPRAVLREFGVELPEATAVRVIDCVSHLRVLVIPRRPAGTEGLSEAELARLVTRDSITGLGVARPAGGAER